MPSRDFQGFDLGFSAVPTTPSMTFSALAPATRTLSDTADDINDDDTIAGEALDMTDTIDGNDILAINAATVLVDYSPGLGLPDETQELTGSIITSANDFPAGANLFFVPDDVSAVPSALTDGSATINNSRADFGTAQTMSLTEAAPICFRNGTKILTPNGEVDVETIRIGDLVTLACGANVPVRWLSRRVISIADQVINPETKSVMIPKNAFGVGMPNRDLHSSQLHRFELSQTPLGQAAGLGQAWSVAKYLVGARGVKVEENLVDFRYHHLLLDKQGLLVANGLPAASLALDHLTRHRIGPDRYSHMIKTFGATSVSTYQNLKFQHYTEEYLQKSFANVAVICG